jgi:hypothetical protein
MIVLRLSCATSTSGRVGCSFIHQKYWNVVFHWIYPPALAAFEALAVFVEFVRKRRLAERTNQYVE